jgi:RNA polymerase sigma-70 factor, ECF subfamily
MIRDLTFSTVDRLQAGALEADETLQMDEDTFRAFYDRTARPLWIYLSRITGDTQLADDLLQETYYRFLRVRATYDGDTHRRNYLYRIATNLVRDGQRRRRPDHVQLSDEHAPSHPVDFAASTNARADLSRAMARLKPRERELLWLAYANGSSHREIAAVLGLKTSSIKLLLFRARRRLAALLRPRGEGSLA